MSFKASENDAVSLKCAFVPEINKFVCSVTVADPETNDSITSLVFEVYASSGERIMATTVMTPATTKSFDFVFEESADTDIYFVKVDISLHGFSRIFQKFAFIRVRAEGTSSSTVSAAKPEKRRGRGFASLFGFSADEQDDGDGDEPAPPIQKPAEEEFDLEISKKKRANTDPRADESETSNPP